MRNSFALVLVGALAMTPACKKKNQEPAATTGSGSAMAPVGSDMAGSAAMGSGSDMAGSAAMGSGSNAAGSAATLTDPQIAAIVVAANQVDIDAGNLALKKSKNAEVKKFAQQMVTDHTAVNKTATDLVTKLKVTPEESDASKSLTSGGADNRAALEKLDGAAFDKAYVDHEVDYHKAVIDTIDTKLIPSAQNAELKSTLTSVKPAIQAHLDHALMLQGKLGSGAGSGGGSAGSAGHKM